MINILILITMLIETIFSELIVNNQFQEQSLYRIKNEDKKIIIWIRFQTQITAFYNIEDMIAFAVIRDHKNINNIAMYFQVYKNNIEIVMIQNNTINKYIAPNNFSEWHCIYLFKQIQFESSTFQEQNIVFTQDQNYKEKLFYGYFNTWQNITFSLKAYKENANILVDSLKFRDHHMINQIIQMVQNNREQIYVQYYFRQTNLKTNQVFFELLDQIEELQFNFTNNNIFFVDYKESSQYTAENIGNQWNFIQIQFIGFDTNINLFTHDYNQSIKITHQQNVDIKHHIGMKLGFYNDLIKIDDIIILSDFNKLPEMNCHPNCLLCNSTQCLKCQYNLSLDSFCQCNQTQYYDFQNDGCNEFYGYFKIEKEVKDDDYQSCSYGYYFDKKLQRCVICPKFQQYECYECLFGTEDWYNKSICKFQEIYTLKFIELYSLDDVLLKNQTKIINFDSSHSQIIKNSRLKYDLNYGQIIDLNKDIFQILETICENNYYLNIKLKKCIKLFRGVLSKRFMNKLEFKVSCKSRFTLVNNRCKSCPQFCKICQFNYSLKQIECLIPKDGYYVDINIPKICDKSCPYCFNSTVCNNTLEQDYSQLVIKTIIFDNCLFYFNKICIYCRPSYFLDILNNCERRQIIINYYQFELRLNQEWPEINMLQIKNLILQSKMISNIVRFQIQMYCAQFQQLSNKNILQKQSQEIGCLQSEKFNQLNRCIEVEQNYKYLSSCGGTYYCPNDRCTYNLIITVTVYISNSQSVIFNDKTYQNLKELLSSIKQQLIHVKQIQITALVYVFESIDQKCTDYNLFFLDYSNLQHLKFTKLKLILEFINQGQFPWCQQDLLINFDYLEINDLVTESSLTFIINADYVRFYNCLFRRSQLIFKIESIEAQFLHTQFISLQLIDSLIEFRNNVTITNIKFINCNFLDIVVNKFSLIYINFLVLDSTQLEYILFDQINISYLSIYNSNFIEINQHCQLFIIRYFKIENSDMHDTQFFLIYKKLNSQSIYQNIVIEFSDFHDSTFIFDDELVNIQNFIVKEVSSFNSKLIAIKGSLYLMNVQFHNIDAEQSSLISIFCKNAQLQELTIQNSNFQQSQLLIIKSDYIQISQLKAINCNYKPNFILISITTTICNIDKLSIVGLKYIGQSFALSSLYIIQLDIKNGFIYDIQIKDITVNQLKIFQIIYQQVEIHYFKLNNLQVNQGTQILNDLIRFIQSSQDSKCLINLSIIQNITMILDQQIGLFSFEGIQGLVLWNNLKFNNISSVQKLYLIECTNQKLLFKYLNLINRDQIGFIQQNNSFIDISHFIYLSLLQEQRNNSERYSIFSNLASKYENYELIISNSIMKNLKQPLINIIPSTNQYFQLFNITIINYECDSNLVTILQQGNQTQKILIKFQYIRIINSQSQQYIIESSNTTIQLSQVCIINSNIGLISAESLQYLKIQTIVVINSTYQNKNLISISKIQGHSILNDIYILNLQCRNLIFNEDSNQQRKTIIQNIYLKQVQAQHVILIKDLNQSPLTIRYLNIQQSYIIGQIFNFMNASNECIQIDHIKIQDSSTLKIFNQITFKIKVYQIYLINIKFLQDFQDGQVIYQNSQSQNCTFQDQQVQIQNNILSVQNYSLDKESPITLSFHNKSSFKQIKISPNILQIKFDNSQIVYFPTGVPIEQYTQFNFKTQEQHQIYQHFAIVSNLKLNLTCKLEQSIDNKPGVYANINQFILRHRVNIIDNFTFLMNPYQNYSYIQNDIICEDFEYVLRFNVRILPCQLGEYLYQNQCKTCDVTKFQYSVNKKAFFCNLIDIYKMEKVKKGQLKLKPAFWRPTIDNNQIEYCNSELCQGGWQVGDQSCVQGQVGALCKECDINNIRGQGQYAKHDVGCLLCDFNYKLLFQGLLIIIWLMFLVYLSYDTNKQVIQQYLYFKISQRKLSDILMRQSLNQVSIIIKIITNYFFYLYLLKDNLQFLYYQVNVSLSFFNHPAKLISPQLDCILEQFTKIQIQYSNLIYNLITPLYILSSFYFIYMILLYFKVSQFKFNFIIITIYSVYLFNQQLILESQIKLLSSVTISGIEWVYSNYQYQFNTKLHFSMIYKLVLPTTIVFIIIPLLIYFQIKKKNKKSINVIKYYGILYREYKHETYYWEIVRIYYKFITIILINKFNQQNKGYLILLFQIQVVLLAYSQPYPLKNLNNLEQQSLVRLNWCLIIIFVMENIQQQLRGIIFAIINISVLLQVIHQLIQKVKQQYKEQIIEVKAFLINKIPKTQTIIDIQSSQRVQNNRVKVKNSFILIKQKAVRIKATHQKNSATLVQDVKQGNDFEIEMTPIQFLFTEQ